MEKLGVLPKNQITFPYLGIEIEVKSTAFSIGDFEIKWYGIIIAAGLLLALLYCFRRMKAFGLDGDRVIDAVFAGIIGGIACARFYYIIFNHENIYTIGDIFNIRKGGLAIYGGLIGAILFGCITAKIRKVRIKPLLDIASMGFFIGQGIGRWGNFFNHEAFGTNTTLPWAMSSGRIQSYLANHAASILEKSGITVDPYLPVHPCFLYESIWCLLCFLFLHLFYKKRHYDGEIFLMYTCLYGFERMFVEGLRTDSLYLGGVRISQVLAAVLFAASLITLIVLRIRFSKTGYPVLYVNTEESKEMLRKAEEELKEEKENSKKKKGRELTKEERIIDDEEIPKTESESENQTETESEVNSSEYEESENTEENENGEDN